MARSLQSYIAAVQSGRKSLSLPTVDAASAGTAATAGSAGTAVSASNIDLSITAAAPIPAFAPVKLNGLVVDTGIPSDVGKLAGISIAAIASGFSDLIRYAGLLTTSYTFTPNADVFVNGTGLSNTPPTSGWVQRVGLAKTVNDLWLEIGPPITL